jgi:RND family efflux transporter MFP subunit
MLMSHRPTFLIWSLLSLVSAGSTGAELPFPVAEAKMQTLPDEQMLDGVVEAVNQSTVSAQTAGRVETIMVDVNDYVPQGAPIIRIRNIEQRAGLEQAQANLREAQARFLEAEAEYNRVRSVYEKKVVTKAQMDAATASFAAAKARLEAAQAGVSQAKESLGYTTINAPYSGIVLQRHVQLGETVQPGKPLMTGFSLDELRVVANVPQRLIVPVRKYKAGAGVTCRMDGKNSIAAEKLTFFPYADPQSNVFKVRVYLPPKPKGSIRACSSRLRFRVGEDSGLDRAAPSIGATRRGQRCYVVGTASVTLAAGAARPDRGQRGRNSGRVGTGRAGGAGPDPGRRLSEGTNSARRSVRMSAATEPRLGLSGAVARKFLLSEITPLLALVGLLMGVFAVLVTPREEEPQINVTFANVFIAFPGATAREVERLVSSPAEQMLAEIEGVEHVYSVSRPGMAVLTVQFKVGQPRTDAIVRLYNKLYSNADWLPPILESANPSSSPRASTMCRSSA